MGALSGKSGIFTQSSYGRLIQNQNFGIPELGDGFRRFG